MSADIDPHDLTEALRVKRRKYRRVVNNCQGCGAAVGEGHAADCPALAWEAVMSKVQP